MPGSLQQQQRWLIWGWGEGRGSSLSPVTHTLLWRWRAEMDLSSRRSLKKKKKTFTFAIHPTAPSDRRTASCWKLSGRVIHRIGRERKKKSPSASIFYCLHRFLAIKRIEHSLRHACPPSTRETCGNCDGNSDKTSPATASGCKGGFCKEVRMH